MSSDESSILLNERSSSVYREVRVRGWNTKKYTSLKPNNEERMGGDGDLIITSKKCSKLFDKKFKFLQQHRAPE